jgi:aminoglycoside phosphotransferase (APT) family kinase protein
VTTFDPLGVVHLPAALEPDWLNAALGIRLLPAEVVVTAVTARPVGTGQVADTFRLALTYDPPLAGPPSVIAKLAAADGSSRSAGLMLRLYEVELSCYLDVPALPGAPRLLYAAYEPAEGWFTMLLEDLAPASAGDDLTGASLPVAEAALRRLAAIHAAGWQSAELAALPWLDRNSAEVRATTATLIDAVTPAFLSRFGPLLDPAHAALVSRFVPRFAAWLAVQDGPWTITHGDYRLDNMLFLTGDPSPFVVDWQTAVWGHPAADVAYFLGGSLTPADRRLHAERLLDVYHQALLAAGVVGYDRAQLAADVRFRSVGGLMMSLGAAMLVAPTERGEAMFATAVARHAAHVLDLAAEEVFPAVGESAPGGHAVDAADEGRHHPGPEPLWNESWYADVVTADGAVGAYVRLGLYPNEGLAWWHLMVCGPGRPLVACAVHDLPVPTEALRVTAAGVDLALEPEDALRTFTVRANVTGRVFEDPRAPYTGAAGRPVEVRLDATWSTDGVPYHYDLTTRYEVPCLVAGSVTVDGERIDLAGAGQRDHSWGVRDWWSFGWCWAAALLEDGERLHIADIRLPQARLPFGYRQRSDVVTPLTTVAVDEDLDADGLARVARIDADGVSYLVEPLAWAPALLSADDGRVSRFPRAMARFTAADGRRGTGWVEWNQPSGPIRREPRREPPS